MAMSWRGQAGVLLRRQKDLYFVTLPSSYEPRGQAGIKIEAEMKVEVSTATGIVEIQDIYNLYQHTAFFSPLLLYWKLTSHH